MSIESRTNKNGEKQYRAVVYISKKKRVSPFVKRKRDAQKFETDFKNLKRNIEVYGTQKAKILENKLFSEYAKEFLKAKVKITQSTRERYESNIRVHIAPQFNGMYLKQITKRDGSDLINKLKLKHSNSGINAIMQTAKAVMNYAVTEGFLSESPFKEIEKLEEDDERNFSYWNKKTMYKFLNFHKGKPRFLLYLIPLYTGLRRGEVVGLKWKNINFDNNFINVKEQRGKKRNGEHTTSLPKSQQSRIVPLSNELKNVLLKAKKDNQSDYVVLNLKGNPIDPSKAYRYFKKDQREAGLREDELIRYHDTRHTFASHYMMNGGNLYDLQNYLGHAKIEQTIRYAHLSPGYMQGTTRFIGLGEGELLSLTTENITHVSPGRHLKLVSD